MNTIQQEQISTITPIYPITHPQGEKALWNSRQVEFEGDTPTNLTSEEMEGSVVPPNIWDNYPSGIAQIQQQ